MSRRSREEARQQEKEAKSRRALKERAYQETQRSVYARIYQEQDAMPDDYEEAFQEEVSPPGRKGKRGRTVLITLLLMLLALVGAALAAHLPPGTDCLDPGTLPPGYRLILVRTAAGSRLMMCFRPRGLYIRRGRIWQAAEAVVAISGELEGARALLPAALMNGELGV